MKRRLFNVLAGVSLVMCAVTVTMWVGSYRWPFEKSVVLFGRIGPNGGLETGNEWAWWVRSQKGCFDIEPRNSFVDWKTPYWRLFILSLTLPAHRFIPWQRLNFRQNRIDQGRCPHCGYDLRATPDRCPECGSPAPPKPADAIATAPPN